VLTIPRRFLINEEGQKKKDYNKRKWATGYG
jgi:hypothetical protein